MAQFKIIMQPKELDGKPLITKGDSQDYLGRVIIELYQGPPNPDGSTDYDPAFAWTVDKSNDLPPEEWLKFLRNGLKGAVRHIEDAYSGGK